MARLRRAPALGAVLTSRLTSPSMLPMTQENHKLSVIEKVGYAFGDGASNLIWMTFIYFQLIFYTDVFGLAAAALATMLAVTRIWDMFFDVFIGTIADRTRTRWANSRPYLLLDGRALRAADREWRPDSRCERASASRIFLVEPQRLHSNANSFQTCNSVHNLLDCNRKHGVRIGCSAAISRFTAAGISDTDAGVAVGAVARWIGRAEEADGRSSERGGEMQRTGIRGDYKFRAAHQGHKRAEFERDRNSRRNPCGADDVLRQIFLSRAEADDGAPTVLFAEFAVQFAVALSRPTFRTPAAAGIQHVKVGNAVACEFLGDAVFVFGADVERKSVES